MLRALFPADERSLDHGWEMARCKPGAADFHTCNDLQWLPAKVPGTAAGALRDIEPIDTADLDAWDFWFRCPFSSDPGSAVLCFDGLATLAEAWLNGRSILISDNMFEPSSASVELERDNELILRFPSLEQALSAKQPRARWRTQLPRHRNLRFFRTTLLGRMPGICPAIPPVGPWRPIRLLPAHRPILTARQISPRLTTSGNGEVDIHLKLNSAGLDIKTAEVLLGTHHAMLNISASNAQTEVSGTITIEDPERWWPHTHGTPYRYPLTVRLTTSQETIEIPLPAIGFRSIDRPEKPEHFGITVNGVSVHCRGACWMPLDLITLQTDRDQLQNVLTGCRDAGMNLLRVSGIGTYESEDFFELCDELGMLVWQDFMFARMDYPFEDPSFLGQAETEVRAVLDNIGHRPSLAVLCGGTEILQQVTMLGLSGEMLSSSWFETTLPDLCQTFRPDVIYSPHSPMGGELPFHADAGISHYFAVGAYQQPPLFAELEPPAFASECLAFSIPPESAAACELIGSKSDVDWTHYDAATPRDNGAEWTFADVTDHYLERRFQVDPTALKSSDPHLYMDACRITVGETMAQAVAAWRWNHRTRGALIWTLKDLGPGPGWGILDHQGNPKAPYYFLKRAWRPTGLYFRDRGTNGLWLGLHNDGPTAAIGNLTLELCRQDGKSLEQASIEIEIGPHTSREWSVDALLGGFLDANYAYRFGPRTYEIAVASFNCTSGRHAVSEYHLLAPRPLNTGQRCEPLLDVSITDTPSGARVELGTDTFVDYLIIDLPGIPLSDNYFPLLPGRPRTVEIGETNRLSAEGSVRVFNSAVRLPLSLGNAA